MARTTAPIPNVSADGNPYTGVPVYDTFDFGTQAPWEQYGGTSLATPMWAAMIAIADQGRSLAGESSLDGPSQTLPTLYGLPSGDFNDITAGGSQPQNQNSTGPAPYTYNTPSGTNPPTFTSTDGFVAQTGYDLTSGIGSPKANLVIPAFIDASQLAFGQQPGTTLAGATISPAITVNVENSTGGIDTTNSGYVTLAIGTNPSGGKLLGTATVKAVNGVATFSGLWIDAAGTGYTLVATLGSLTSATSSAFNITANSAQPVIVTPASSRFQPGDHREHVAFGPGQRSQQPDLDIHMVDDFLAQRRGRRRRSVPTARPPPSRRRPPSAPGLLHVSGHNHR